jgi:hypothetical protein
MNLDALFWDSFGHYDPTQHDFVPIPFPVNN